MSLVGRRGAELRRMVRRRRFARWLGVASMSLLVVLAVAMLARRPHGLEVAMLCAGALGLVANLASFHPALELRALRSEVTAPPLTIARARRWAAAGFVVAGIAIAVALLVGALLGAWLTALGIALPIALLGVVWGLAVLWSARTTAQDR